jgi:hypothetical protein
MKYTGSCKKWNSADLCSPAVTWSAESIYRLFVNIWKGPTAAALQTFCASKALAQSVRDLNPAT